MPPLTITNLSGKQYWRSLDEVADTPEFREFMHHEFPAGAADLMDGAGRRDFLKIMAASMALAGLGMGGCRRWPQENIAPFASRPNGRTPGVPVFYASSRPNGAAASSLLVTSQDGRPIKVDGNPDHSGNRGKSSVFDQASVLDLYDPDRSRRVHHDGAESDWNAFTSAMGPHFNDLRSRSGIGLYVLSESTSSPTDQAMKRRLMSKFTGAQWIEYEALPHDSELDGTKMAFGSPSRPQYDLTHARYIVSLDSDFLFEHADSIAHIGDFAAGRTADGPDHAMNRLYSFEATLSLTGANADHRVPVRSSDVALVAAYLAQHVLGDQSLAQFEAHDAGHVLNADLKAILDDHVLADLQHHPGQGVIIAGPRQPAAVHMLAHLMNLKLGNVGTTVSYTSRPNDDAHITGIRDLATAIDAGDVSTLVIIGGNPTYNAPADLKFAEKLATVKTTIHLSDYVDETSAGCTWHINRAHYLEAWGDGRSHDGTYGVGQPLILPLFGGKSTPELLAFMVGGSEPTDGLSLVRRTYQEMTGSSDDDAWKKTLHDGYLRGSAAARSNVRASGNIGGSVNDLFAWWSSVDRKSTEVIFAADYSVYDGRFANNGWLQELPDPLTKITWDNAAIISPQRARDMGLEMKDSGATVNIKVGDQMVSGVPVYIMPGHADDSVTLPLGYGRSFEGRICQGAGFNFYRLRSSGAMGFVDGATVDAAGEHYALATTQDHHAVDMESSDPGGRSIQERLPTLVREGTLTEFRDHPNFAKHRAHVVHRLSMWDETNLEEAKYAWGMSIDLTACVGCNSCVVACQAENNIPIVGKDQVSRGREMHWIRLDRYFKFGQDTHGKVDPNKYTGVALQPVNCMHCENAPCEQVCPVAATVHDKDGLNVMIYNRCIGTRYCSNNCPYKVRRFNYFDYHRREPARENPGVLLQVEPTYYTKEQGAKEPLEQLQQNPEVSVRIRGVMEKCTYCVQRITAARIDAKNDWVNLDADDPRRQNKRVPIGDGVIQTACEQSCPANAIVFGDLMDRNSRIAKMHEHARTYEMLEEINTKPRTKYLAKLRNPAFGDDHGSGAGHDGNHANGEAH